MVIPDTFSHARGKGNWVGGGLSASTVTPELWTLGEKEKPSLTQNMWPLALQGWRVQWESQKDLAGQEGPQ